jgi:hypothetical protein
MATCTAATTIMSIAASGEARRRNRRCGDRVGGTGDQAEAVAHNLSTAIGPRFQDRVAGRHCRAFRSAEPIPAVAQVASGAPCVKDLVRIAR